MPSPWEVGILQYVQGLERTRQRKEGSPLSWNMDPLLPSAFLAPRTSDLDWNLPQQLSGSQAF